MNPSRSATADARIIDTWSSYWRGYRGVTAVGAWSQRQALGRVKAVMQDARIPPGSRIIDVGAGEGRTLAVLRSWGYTDSIGIDATDESLAICRKAGFRIGRDVMKRDARQTGFAGGSFDVVFSEGLLEHFPDPSAIIDEMARISRRYILLIQPNHYSPYGKAIAVYGNMLRGNVLEYTFSREYFVTQFAGRGFPLVRETTTMLGEFFVFLFARGTGAVPAPRRPPR